ncbi:MAG: GNAT family N-acetyltransferase [Fimbriimonadaceae bacterium]|nr:GNAT family N-acetyltransferase [Fimbriimonadaceae bacterium]
MTLQPLRPSHAAAVASCHTACLRGLLSELGTAVATAFYGAAAGLPETVALVATAAAQPVGFVAGSLRPDGYYRRVALAAPLAVGGRLAARLAVRPALLRHLLAGGEAASTVPELLFLAVAPSQRGQGLGATLCAAFEEALQARGATCYELAVEADNAAAIGFYEHRGLQRVATLTEFGLPRYRYRWSAP